MNPENSMALLPFYCLMAALAIITGIFLGIILLLVRQNKKREKINASRYPMVGKPVGKVKIFYSNKN